MREDARAPHVFLHLRTQDECFRLIREVKPDLQLTVCGSYRRGKPDSGDMDVLVTHPSFIDSGRGSQAVRKFTLAMRKSH